MGKTNIQWTASANGMKGAVWNPIHGCDKVSAGCLHCYAERMSKRLAGRVGYDKEHPFRVTLRHDRLDQPIYWTKPQFIFVSSMGDLFHDDVPPSFIEQVLQTMDVANWHRYLLLTKRPERMRKDLAAWFYNPRYNHSHIWAGVSAENQRRFDERVPVLMDTPAGGRFVSLEPLLGPIDISKFVFNREVDIRHLMYGPVAANRDQAEWAVSRSLDWVISGPETGPGHRLMDPAWPRSLRDQCATARVPFFYKEKGGILDGRVYQERPDALTLGMVAARKEA